MICSMWLFKHKFNADGSLSCYKAWLVSDRHSQQHGIDCDETFSSFVKLKTIRTVLSLDVSRNWLIHQLDMKNTFLHGHLHKTVYMHQPQVFRDLQHLHYVFHIHRSLYGLNYAHRSCYQRFALYALNTRFQYSLTDPSLFVYHHGPDTAYLLLYILLTLYRPSPP